MRLMDIASYLKKRRQYLGRSSANVKNFAVFDYNYIPDEPVQREEVKEIIKHMVRFEKTSVPTHMSIVGSRGSGKTLMLKYLQKIIS